MKKQVPTVLLALFMLLLSGFQTSSALQQGVDMQRSSSDKMGAVTHVSKSHSDDATQVCLSLTDLEFNISLKKGSVLFFLFSRRLITSIFEQVQILSSVFGKPQRLLEPQHAVYLMCCVFRI